ncbi:hypothetical protein pb186bvf_014893 [Paramecium bursaria]
MFLKFLKNFNQIYNFYYSVFKYEYVFLIFLKQEIQKQIQDQVQW